jgi:hypothetical protein
MKTLTRAKKNFKTLISKGNVTELLYREFIKSILKGFEICTKGSQDWRSWAALFGGNGIWFRG